MIKKINFHKIEIQNRNVDINLVFGKGVDTPYSWIVCISAFFINFFAVGSSFLVTGTLSSYWRNELCAFDNRSCTGK